MLKIREYKKVESLEEAYQLNQNKRNLIIGGMLWLKMMDRDINVAIDMSGLGLDKIEETEDSYEIGAMTTLRQLEMHKGLNQLTQGAMKESVRHIVGVQFRNCATVGGSIFGRYGFSDVLTMFLAMDAKVKLFNAGIVSLHEFNNMKLDNDIIVSIIVDKKEGQYVYKSVRNTTTDFPVATCALSYVDGKYTCAIGAMPYRAKQFKQEDMSVEEFKAYVDANIKTRSNNKASGTYRKKMANVLLKRAIKTVEGGSN